MNELRFTALVVSATLLVACGGATPTAEPAVATAPAPGAYPPATEAPAEPEPTSIEEAEAQIKRARERLEQPSLKASPQADHDRYLYGESEECRALHSLERATKALCRLAGQEDTRCKDATAAYEKSRTRVTCR